MKVRYLKKTKIGISVTKSETMGVVGCRLRSTEPHLDDDSLLKAA